MKGITLLVITILCFLVAYVTYGSWLAKQWDIDPKRKTPAHDFEDGVDYIPAKAPVLLGHHFASIAGALSTDLFKLLYLVGFLCFYGLFLEVFSLELYKISQLSLFLSDTKENL